MDGALPCKTEAEFVAATRLKCSYCGDDSQQPVKVRVQVPHGPSVGTLICPHCVTEATSLTGWNAEGYADPLGTAEPIPEAGDRPAGWREIAAVLRGDERLAA